MKSGPLKDSSSGSDNLQFFSLAHARNVVIRSKCEHLVAGFTGGVISTLLLHPLDLLKIRFAVDDGKVGARPRYSGLSNAVSSIFRSEGLSGFYKGVTPSIAGAGTAWGLYFLFYNQIKSYLQKGDSKKQLSPLLNVGCAVPAGLLTLTITNPIWVIKTRLCLQFDTALQKDPKYYRGMVDAFLKIGRTEGLSGLYKGFVPGTWGVSHGAIQFMVYEELKASYSNYYNQPIDTKLGTLEYLSFSSLSKLLATVVTYPYQVVRARLQEKNSRYTGALDCVIATLRNEGLSGCYKGIKPHCLRVIPATAITFFTYEKVSQYFKD